MRFGRRRHAVQGVEGGRRLHGDHREGVGEDIVDLAGDHQALLGEEAPFLVDGRLSRRAHPFFRGETTGADGLGQGRGRDHPDFRAEERVGIERRRPRPQQRNDADGDDQRPRDQQPPVDGR